jgi:hypothetical protein
VVCNLGKMQIVYWGKNARHASEGSDVGRPKSSHDRINVGLTKAAMERLDVVRALVGREVDKTGLTNNLVCTWIVHAVLAMPEKQMVKLIASGKARAESDLKGGNPGHTNGHSTGGGRVFIAPEERERIVPPRPVPGSRKHSKSASYDTAPHASDQADIAIL